MWGNRLRVRDGLVPAARPSRPLPSLLGSAARVAGRRGEFGDELNECRLGVTQRNPEFLGCFRQGGLVVLARGHRNNKRALSLSGFDEAFVDEDRLGVADHIGRVQAGEANPKAPKLCGGVIRVRAADGAGILVGSLEIGPWRMGDGGGR